jgi:hypothetical protein
MRNVILFAMPTEQEFIENWPLYTRAEIKNFNPPRSITRMCSVSVVPTGEEGKQFTTTTNQEMLGKALDFDVNELLPSAAACYSSASSPS